ncbi:hypothetical protein [Microbacterium sp. CR_7]|uniref:hypothetical protein n=1 Tax=Microbacterium sp. CR_7 TaxID=3055792 RepID=UPI0035C0BFE3
MPIKIDFISNTRDLIRGTDDAEKALDDVADSLDDMTRDAKDGSRDAERAVERLEDSFRDAARRAKDLGDAGDDAGDKVRRGMRDADDDVRRFGRTSEEVGDELKQNLGETFSSFRGDLEDLPQIAQDTLGGLAGSGALGGIPGLVATAAGAAGIGMLIGAFESMDEAAKESAQRANDWADAYIEAGGRLLSFEQQMAKVRDITTNQYDVASKNAELWGVSVETAIAAMAGSQSALDDVSDSVNKQSDAAARAAVEAQKMAEASGGTLGVLTQEEQKAAAAADALNLLTGEMDRGAQQADVYSRLLADTARSTEGATEAVDDFGDSIVTLPGGKQVYIDAETGQATADVDAISNKIYSVPDGHATVRVTGDTTDIDRKLRVLSGTTLKIGARIVTSGPGWDQ